MIHNRRTGGEEEPTPRNILDPLTRLVPASGIGPLPLHRWLLGGERQSFRISEERGALPLGGVRAKGQDTKQPTNLWPAVSGNSRLLGTLLSFTVRECQVCAKQTLYT
eukprot:1005264-Pyramimonas_sp.AAC.1